MGPKAVFFGLAGQAHVLGIILAAEAFRQAGWDVELQLEQSSDEIVEVVRTTELRLVGLTAGREASLDRIAAIISRIKVLPDPPSLLVGGVASSLREEFVVGTGADLVVSNIEQALEQTGPIRKALE